MKTSIRTWIRNDKTITLIGCCHIGTEKYYDIMNQKLREFSNSQVIFEGVLGSVNDIGYDLTKFYKRVSLATGYYFQGERIEYSKQWTNGDLDASILKSANGGNLFEIQKDEVDFMDEISDKLLRKIFKMVIMFTWLLNIIKGRNVVIIDMRNSKCILDSFEMLKTEDRICILYGDDHLNGIEKFIKKVGFRVQSQMKLNPFE